jgi:hypothetical protein
MELPVRAQDRPRHLVAGLKGGDIRERYRLGIERGSPNHGSTVFSKRVIALI